MSRTEDIKKAFERNQKAIRRMPSIGLGTAVTQVRVREGLLCDVEDGSWKLTSDLSEKAGGDNAAPNPGVLIRSALGSCMAMAYVLWAAKMDVPLEDIEVEVQADYDTRGMYGIDDIPAGYTDVRCKVRLKSDAPEADILEVLDAGDRHSPYFDVFNRVYNLKREVEIVKATRRAS